MPGLITAFALGLALASPAALADEAADNAPVWVLPRVPGAPDPPPLTLRERVCETRTQLEAAKLQREASDTAYRRARRNDYPRGELRQLLKEQRVRRRRELVEAEAALAAIEEEADRAPLSWRLLEPCSEPELPAKAATRE